MTDKGGFIWYELMTGDADGATRFYEAVVGWSVANPKADGFDYREIQAGSEYVGGMLPLTAEMRSGGARSGWLGYINVDEVDRTVDAVLTAGGKVYMPAHDMEGIGRFALVADPQGAPFYVMKPIPPKGQEGKSSEAFSPAVDGHCGWNELATSDPAAARSFYGDLFGWDSDDFMSMGEMGEYRFLDHDGTRIGALCGLMPGQQPRWRYYFKVPSIAAAKDIAEKEGGKIAMGPHEVPTGDWILIGFDPQGVEFALVGKA